MQEGTPSPNQIPEERFTFDKMIPANDGTGRWVPYNLRPVELPQIHPPRASEQSSLHEDDLLPILPHGTATEPGKEVSAADLLLLSEKLDAAEQRTQPLPGRRAERARAAMQGLKQKTGELALIGFGLGAYGAIQVVKLAMAFDEHDSAPRITSDLETIARTKHVEKTLTTENKYLKTVSEGYINDHGRTTENPEDVLKAYTETLYDTLTPHDQTLLEDIADLLDTEGIRATGRIQTMLIRGNDKKLINAAYGGVVLDWLKTHPHNHLDVSSFANTIPQPARDIMLIAYDEARKRATQPTVHTPAQTTRTTHTTTYETWTQHQGTNPGDSLPGIFDDEGV